MSGYAQSAAFSALRSLLAGTGELSYCVHLVAWRLPCTHRYRQLCHSTSGLTTRLLGGHMRQRSISGSAGTEIPLPFTGGIVAFVAGVFLRSGDIYHWRRGPFLRYS